MNLVIGANGLVGRQLTGILSGLKLEWVGTCNKREEPGLSALDITDKSKIDNFMGKAKPKAVFLCANLAGGVDFCQANQDLAKRFHLDATAHIAQYCARNNAKLIFISTDYIFDGTKGPYKEDGAPNPLNAYGRLKLEAEQFIRKNLRDYLIARTTNVFGYDPKTVTPNFAMGLYKSLKSGAAFNAPSFLWGNPTYAFDLAAAIAELYLNKASGVFHIVGPTFISRYEWAKRFCEIFGFDKSLINEIKEPKPGMAARPLSSWLSAEKFNGSYKTALHDLDAGLNLMKDSISD